MWDDTDDYEIVDVYKGDDTTIYYDLEGEQHVVVNENEDVKNEYNQRD